MTRRILIYVLSLALMLTLGCSDPAADIYETAQFEEQQFNKAHATELYQRIITDHPDSPYAAKARESLKMLQEKQN